MSRLIDADKAVERYSKELHKLIEAGCDPFAGSCEAIRDIMQAFDRQPPAYNLESVVGQLEAIKKDRFTWCMLQGMKACGEYADCTEHLLSEIIKLVKAGEYNG